MVPVAIVPHPHQPVLRFGRRIEEALIGHLRGRCRDGKAEARAERGRGKESGEAEVTAAGLLEIKRVGVTASAVARRTARSRFGHLLLPMCDLVMPNHNIAPAQGHRLAAISRASKPVVTTLASSRYPHNVTVEVGRQMGTQV